MEKALLSIRKEVMSCFIRGPFDAMNPHRIVPHDRGRSKIGCEGCPALPFARLLTCL